MWKNVGAEKNSLKKNGDWRENVDWKWEDK